MEGAASRNQVKIYTRNFSPIPNGYVSLSRYLRRIRVQVANSSGLASVDMLLYNNRANGLVSAHLAPGLSVVAARYRSRSAALGGGVLETLRVVVVLLDALPAGDTSGRAGEANATATLVGSGGSGLDRGRCSKGGRLNWGRRG